MITHLFSHRTFVFQESGKFCWIVGSGFRYFWREPVYRATKNCIPTSGHRSGCPWIWCSGYGVSTWIYLKTLVQQKSPGCRKTMPTSGHLHELDAEAYQSWGEAESRMKAMKKALSSLWLWQSLCSGIHLAFYLVASALQGVLLLGSLAVKMMQNNPC